VLAALALSADAQYRWLPPRPAPAARFGASLVWDGRQGHVTLFGGQSYQTTFSDLWRWDEEGWKPLVAPGTAPPARSHAALAADPLR